MARIDSSLCPGDVPDVFVKLDVERSEDAALEGMGGLARRPGRSWCSRMPTDNAAARRLQRLRYEVMGIFPRPLDESDHQLVEPAGGAGGARSPTGTSGPTDSDRNCPWPGIGRSFPSGASGRGSLHLPRAYGLFPPTQGLVGGRAPLAPQPTLEAPTRSSDKWLTHSRRSARTSFVPRRWLHKCRARSSGAQSPPKRALLQLVTSSEAAVTLGPTRTPPRPSTYFPGHRLPQVTGLFFRVHV